MKARLLKTGMLPLSVKLEDQLFNSLAVAAKRANGDVSVFRTSLEKLVSTEELFASAQQVILSAVESWFDLENMARSASFWEAMNQMRTFLSGRLNESVEHLLHYVPLRESTPMITVYLAPGFSKCYGPRDGVQLFALRHGADFQEALLFLIHVYYHEISSLFYTESSARASRACESPALLRHLVRLLIQNEGLANFIVLDPLLALRKQRCRFLYFTYADLIGVEAPTINAMRLCREILVGINEQNFQYMRVRLSELFKNPGLPLINLIGVHLAQAIAKRFGVGALFETARAEPQEFFRLYHETDDSLRLHLFGTAAETDSVFCSC